MRSVLLAGLAAQAACSVLIDPPPDPSPDRVECAPWTHQGGGTAGLDDQWNAVEPLDGCEMITCGEYRGVLRLGGPEQSVDSAGAGDAVVARFDAGGDPLWVNSFGDVNDDSCQFVLREESGDLLIAGTFHDTITFGPSTLTAMFPGAFIARIDPETGESPGAVSLVGDGDVVLNAVERDADGNLYLGGLSFAGSLYVDSTPFVEGPPGAFVGSLDPGRGKRWSKYIAGGPDGVRAIALGGEPTRLLVVGEYTAELDAGPGCIAPIPVTTSSFIAAFDPDTGECQWMKTIDAGVDFTIELKVAVYAPGVDKLVVAGVSRRAAGAVENPSSFTGSFKNAAHGGNEAFVATYFLDGTPLDWRWIGGEGNDSIGPLAVYDDDTVLVASTFEDEVTFGSDASTRFVASGRTDVAVARIRVSGEDLEERGAIVHGGNGDDFVTDMAIRGDVVLVGGYDGFLDGTQSTGAVDLCVAAGRTLP